MGFFSIRKENLGFVCWVFVCFFCPFFFVPWCLVLSCARLCFAARKKDYYDRIALPFEKKVDFGCFFILIILLGGYFWPVLLLAILPVPIGSELGAERVIRFALVEGCLFFRGALSVIF